MQNGVIDRSNYGEQYKTTNDKICGIGSRWEDITGCKKELLNGDRGLLCLNTNGCSNLALFKDSLAYCEKLGTTHSRGIVLYRCKNAIIDWPEIVNGEPDW